MPREYLRFARVMGKIAMKKTHKQTHICRQTYIEVKDTQKENAVFPPNETTWPFFFFCSEHFTALVFRENYDRFWLCIF